MGRRTLLLIASMLVAALGTSLVWLYVQGAQQPPPGLVQAYFLEKPAPAGTRGADLAAAAKLVSPDAAKLAVSPQQVAGKVLMENAVAGQLLVKDMFGTYVSTSVPAGKIYVAITVTDPHRVPALLRTGDSVAVYALAQGAANKAAKLVASSVQVQTIGSATTPGANGAQVPVTIVGFSVDPTTARDLINIETYGQPELAILGQGAQAVD